MTHRALLMLLEQPNKHREAAAFSAGLEACGYSVHRAINDPGPDDLLLVWNRMGAHHTIAKRFEAARARVIVAENGYLGADWRGARWFAMSLGHHNGRGRWPLGGPERWDGWGVELAPMRQPGVAGVMLAQRGIGEPALRAPSSWTSETAAQLRFRIRKHPGNALRAVDVIPLAADLADVGVVATWSSGAALKALMLGVHVIYGLPGWIGAPAATAYGSRLDTLDRRLGMFRRLAWAMWTEEEAASGEAFKGLLAC